MTSEPGGELVLDGIRRSFGDRVALDGVNLRVGAGQMVGFVGTNGAGKTTTMRIALGVLSADAGTVTWAGQPVDAEVRRRFGYMPEERGLYPKMRVVDQLVYLARLHGASVGDAKAAAQRWTEVLGVADRGGDRVEALSLGNQQRVQLAAALVHDPDVLVLDEPFSGLDPVGVDALAGVLHDRVNAGAAVVFSSHQLELVERLCDRVAIIRAGRMVADGTVDELRATAGRPAYRVAVVDADGRPVTGWDTELPGERLSTSTAGQLLVRLADADAEQHLLALAQGAGRVVVFAPHQPTLAEVFRDVVTPAVEPGAAA